MSSHTDPSIDVQGLSANRSLSGAEPKRGGTKLMFGSMMDQGLARSGSGASLAASRTDSQADLAGVASGNAALQAAIQQQLQVQQAQQQIQQLQMIQYLQQQQQQQLQVQQALAAQQQAGATDAVAAKDGQSQLLNTAGAIDPNALLMGLHPATMAAQAQSLLQQQGALSREGSQADLTHPCVNPMHQVWFPQQGVQVPAAQFHAQSNMCMPCLQATVSQQQLVQLQQQHEQQRQQQQQLHQQQQAVLAAAAAAAAANAQAQAMTSPVTVSQMDALIAAQSNVLRAHGTPLVFPGQDAIAARLAAQAVAATGDVSKAALSREASGSLTNLSAAVPPIKERSFSSLLDAGTGGKTATSVSGATSKGSSSRKSTGKSGGRSGGDRSGRRQQGQSRPAQQPPPKPTRFLETVRVHPRPLSTTSPKVSKDNLSFQCVRNLLMEISAIIPECRVVVEPILATLTNSSECRYRNSGNVFLALARLTQTHFINHPRTNMFKRTLNGLVASAIRTTTQGRRGGLAHCPTCNEEGKRSAMLECGSDDCDVAEHKECARLQYDVVQSRPKPNQGIPYYCVWCLRELPELLLKVKQASLDWVNADPANRRISTIKWPVVTALATISVGDVAKRIMTLKQARKEQEARAIEHGQSSTSNGKAAAPQHANSSRARPDATSTDRADGGQSANGAVPAGNGKSFAWKDEHGRHREAARDNGHSDWSVGGGGGGAPSLKRKLSQSDLQGSSSMLPMPHTLTHAEPARKLPRVVESSDDRRLFIPVQLEGATGAQKIQRHSAEQAVRSEDPDSLEWDSLWCCMRPKNRRAFEASVLEKTLDKTQHRYPSKPESEEDVK